MLEKLLLDVEFPCYIDTILPTTFILKMNSQRSGKEGQRREL